MNTYSTSAIVSFIILFMGIYAFGLGARTFFDNTSSKSGFKMFCLCITVFFWDFGYAWMGLCHGDDFAYIPRAIALFAVYTYMYFIIDYISYLAKVSKRIIFVYGIIYSLASLYSWFGVIDRSAVTFTETPWGYWYYSEMTTARIVQFGCIIIAFIMFYKILLTWRKKAVLKREISLTTRFVFFGPILIAGYLFDTLFPSLFHTAAVPGSAIGAFFSAMLLYSISKKYKAFGVSVTNVSEYVFNEVKVPVIVLDWENNIVLFNDIAPEFFGITAEEMLGLSRDRFVEVAKITDAENSEQQNIRMASITGNYYLPIRNKVNDEFDELQFSIIFVQDMTETYNTMNMLVESRKIAEEASVSKSNFLANISHDMRTPMNAIIGMSEIVLRKNDLDQETKSQVRSINDAGAGLLALINDILDISKIEAGKYELIEGKYELASLINDVSTLIYTKMQETTVRFEMSVSPHLPVNVYGDDRRVSQILVNILGNASKFTNKGSVKFSINCEMKDDIAKLIFVVEDTGIGISKDDLDNIFGAFNQVDTRKNRNITGSGLGLTISRDLAKLMGGDIEVSSEYGVGSTFKITILQKVDEYEEIGMDTAMRLEQRRFRNDDMKNLEDEQDTYPDKRILIVDDTKVNLMVAKGLLTPYEMQVDLAPSGKMAIEMVKHFDYDLVFMDHMIPEMDGVDTTHAIRALDGDKYKNLVIVALTANAVTGTREALINEGMQDFLAKPINKKELRAILRKWLKSEVE